MKNQILFTLFLTLALTLVAPFSKAYGPEDKRFGLGLYLGEPTGVTGKFYFQEKTSIQAIASWSFFDEAVTVVGDALFDLVDLSGNSRDFTLPFYIGAGAKLSIHNDNANDDSTFGIRMPIGIAWQSADVPLEIAFEVSPGIDLSPETEFDVGGGLVLRFYF